MMDQKNTSQQIISLGFHVSKLEFSTYMKAVPNLLCIWGGFGVGAQGLTHGKQTLNCRHMEGLLLPSWGPEAVAMAFS